MDNSLQLLAVQVVDFLRKYNFQLSTAESCTGGLVAAAITEVPGSSACFERGFVTYSNAAKEELLNVQKETLNMYGAVSETTAAEMATGALKQSHAQISLAITGIAGPCGGTPAKPVGTVCFAWQFPNQPIRTTTQLFTGNRVEIRNSAASYALREILAFYHA